MGSEKRKGLLEQTPRGIPCDVFHYVEHSSKKDPLSFSSKDLNVKARLVHFSERLISVSLFNHLFEKKGGGMYG